jgi:hypothetical protein
MFYVSSKKFFTEIIPEYIAPRSNDTIINNSLAYLSYFLYGRILWAEETHNVMPSFCTDYLH